MRSHPKASILLPACLFLGLIACKGKEETAPPVGPATPVGAPSEDKSDDGSQADVAIDPELAKLCGIEAPKFGFNSASVSKEAAATLDALVACFTTGPGQGRRLALVGHADPRGSEEYNFGLGQRRAGNIEKYVLAHGLAAERCESSSRGELDATGTDESGWARDRRVDLRLAP